MYIESSSKKYINNNINAINTIIQLLDQFKNDNLTISQEQFKLFISQLNEHHTIFVIEDQEKIICRGTILIETKLIRNCGKVGHIEDII
jgi:glucosamine-phosphate N-acetyltransferase